MIFKILRISGGSLAPQYQPGDYVFVSKIPIWLRGIRPGDVVVYDHPGGGERVKIVERLEDGGRSLFLVGTSPESIDSRSYGTVPAWLVKGKVLGRVSKSN